ncbi:UNVERIFIED_CONTAM: hypothetical protein FKN15_035634 [Acipenser sinensis]
MNGVLKIYVFGTIVSLAAVFIGLVDSLGSLVHLQKLELQEPEYAWIGYQHYPCKANLLQQGSLRTNKAVGS